MNDETQESPDFKNPMDTLSEITIERIQHDDATVTLKSFSALDGWELKRQYREYLTSDDAGLRMAYTLIVLSYSTIPVDGNSKPLNNAGFVNEQLESWQNVEKVFHAVLAFNGIKTDPTDIERVRWQVAGEELAKGFLASVSDLMGPAFKLAAQGKIENGVMETGTDAA